MAVARMNGKLSINSTIRMASGYDMPVVGFGVYQTPAKECARVVAHALKCGYRHVDSAAAYRNEAACASALLASGLKRSEYFFTSKVPPGKISYDGAKKTVEETLQNCDGVEYVDLMLLHAPYGGKENRLGAWDALNEAVREGKIRSIGVSNYGVHHLEELKSHIRSVESRTGEAGSGGVIAVNQIELHPWLTRPDIVKWCQDNNVVCQAYSPLARATRWGDKSVQTVCKETGKNEAQVLVRWSLQMGFVPLPKSVTESRIEDNLKVFGWELSQAQMDALKTDEYSPSAWDPTTTKD